MAYNMTPQERMQRAAQLRAQREARLGYTPTSDDLSRYLLPTERSVGRTQSVEPVATEKESQNNGFDLGRWGATALDTVANVGLGALDVFEGIYDLGAGAFGAIGGIFSEQFQKDVQKHIADDWSGGVEKALDDAGLFYSYLNEEGVGEFVGGVARGVGQLLPAVFVSAATVGVGGVAAKAGMAGAAAKAATVAPKLALGTTIAGAAGQSTEEAYNDGADYLGGLAYGAASGAIEGVTEKLTGGVTKKLFGKGLLDGTEAVAKQGGKRILKGMAEEAAEEGLATAVNPLAKTIYKGGEALKEYTEPEFYGDVLHDAASGAATAGAFEFTVGRITHQTGKDAGISDAQESIKELQKKRRSLQSTEAGLTDAADAEIVESGRKNLENISKTLKSASDKTRAKLIERHRLAEAFDERGEIKPDFAAKMFGRANTAPNTDSSHVENLQSADKRYYSADMRGSEADLVSDAEKIQTDLRAVTESATRNELKGMRDTEIQAEVDRRLAETNVKLFDGELSEAGQKNLRELYGVTSELSDHTPTGISVAVVDSGGKMHGVVLGNRIYIDKSVIENGTYAKPMIEEIAHFSEGTKSYGKLLKFIAEDNALYNEVVGELVGKGNSYGFTKDMYDSLIKKSESGEELTPAERSLANEINAHMVAETFGNEGFMQKIIKGEPTLAEKLINRVKALARALSGAESAEAKTQRKRLEKAEKLWMKSVEDAGYKYVKGKLIKRLREKAEEEEKTASTGEVISEKDPQNELDAEVEGEEGTEEDVSYDHFDDPQTRAYVNDSQFSLKFAPQIAEAQREYIDEHNSAITSVELDRAIDQTKKMVDKMSSHADILPKDTVGKTLVKNGSYDISVENTTICIRTLAYNSFVDMVSEKIGRPLTKMESFLVSQKLYEIAQEPQCLYCYVSLDRMAYNEMVVRYVQQRDEAIRAWKKAGRPNVTSDSDLYKKFLDGRKPTQHMWDRYSSWIDFAKKGEKLLSLEDLSTEAKRSELTLGTDSQKAQVQDILKYAQSASWAKKQTQFVAYKDEILKLPQRTINALNKHYGLRWYSFSDYSGAFIVENMQQITDAAIRGLKGLAYTKDTDFVKIFAPTGMNINVSVYAMKDGKGGYVIDPKQSADIEEAIKLREKYSNVGIVVVATDTDGVKWALDQEWSDVVIPFHTVRTGADVANFYDWEVFNAEQADSVEDGNLWEAYVDSVASTASAKKKVSKNIYPSEHQNDRDTYFRILKERGLKARFSTFADHPHYMKLVNETRQSESETRKLTPTFALDAAEASFDKFVEKGGYYEGWYNDGIDVDAEAEIVAEDVRAGRKPNEVPYSLKDVDYEAMQKQRKTQRTHSGGSQFSLPKRQSDGARAKANANRSKSKTYTREDSEIIADAVVQESTVFADEHGSVFNAKFKGKGKLIEELWVYLNTTDEKSGKRGGVALNLANAVIAHTMVTLSADDPIMEAFRERIDVLSSYLHKLDIESIKGETEYKEHHSRYNSRWKQTDGKGMTPDQIKDELRDRGVVIDADNPADILLEMDRMYTEAMDGIAENSNLLLEQILSDADLEHYRQYLASAFLREMEGKGSMSKRARSYYDLDQKRKEEGARAKKAYDENVEKLREIMRDYTEEMREKFSNEREEHRLSRQIAFRAERLKKLKLGKMHEASGFNAPLFRKSIGSLGSIMIGGNVNAKKARKASAELAQWLKWMEEQNAAAAKENEGRSFDLKKLREYLEELTSPDRAGQALTVQELKNLSYVMARLTTYVNDYGKIRRNGKMIDALPVAEGYVEKSKKSSRISRGPLRAFREWFLGKFADPATVMRYADGYDEHGFFTEVYNEFREGAITVEVTRMELMESYAKFLETHKKYEDRLVETVEFRGQRIPRKVLISLWMTTKRKQAQLGLAMEGAQYRYDPSTKAEKKTDDGTRVFDIAPFGDPTRDLKSHPYTEAELEAIMKDIRAEIDKSLNDTDRAYIKMVEGIFKECGEIKRDVDMKRLGETNVDETQYYFPIARADIAQTIEQESWQQGLDRVSHLSMNKDTVKGAHNRLYLSGVDAILMRHVNQVSLYNGIATAVDNFNILANLKINDTGAAITVNNTVTRTDYGKAALDYLKKLKNDIERVSHVDLDDAGVTNFLSYLRSAYATSTLGANLKVWATQGSSFIAAYNVLDADSITKGALLKMGKVNDMDEVDVYCPIAKHRNATNTAYEAQSVSARSIRKVSKVNDLLMKPIGAVDRFVIERLWGGCQVQIEKNGGAKVGTEENKQAAGKLLEKVILETQQNALATERSSAMRSSNEVLKSLTMFSADAMKMIGRFFDAYGEASVIRQKLKDTTLTDTERKSLEARQKTVHKSLARSIAVLLSSAAFMAAIAAAFKALLGEYEDKEPEEVARDITADGIGNLFGGLPLVRDVYSFLTNGYEINMNLLTPVNGLLDATNALTTLASDGASGKNVSSQEIASAIRKGFYAGGQVLGLPAKNVYKYAAGFIKLISPETGYAIDSVFTKPSVKADLAKAIEAGDNRMIARIAEIATNENYGMYSESTRKALQSLVEKGHTVFPRSVGDTLTVDGETYELTDKQRKRFEKVYAISDQAVEELVALKQFKDATDAEQAKALKYIYDTYYSIAIDDLLGTDTTQKSVLFAELIDIEKLAMIAAHVSTLTADKDKDGKTVSGSRKNKIVAYVSRLNLTAAEKYMVMGYLGYKNTNGEIQVKSAINKTSLSAEEKKTLLSYCGYAA